MGLENLFMGKTKKNFFLVSCFLFLAFLLVPLVVTADYTYTPMENIPGFENISDFPGYLLAIYKFGIWTVGIVALFMIIWGGFMYLTSAGNTSRMDSAKTVIFDAFYGLIVALAAWLILFVINPDLVKVKISITPVAVVAPPVLPPIVPPPPPGLAGTCQGLPTQTGISSQCKDVSPSLSGLLLCIYNSQPNATISSISDSAGYDLCKNNYSRPPCAHAQNSCHYGGSCTDGSHAVDFSTSNLSAATLIQAGTACGASYTLNEGNHVHLSVGSGCGCN